MALSPIESPIFEQLLQGAGSVVRRADLSGAAWPDGAPGDPRAHDVRVKVRRRLTPLGLRVHTVATKGYLLEAPA